MTFASLRSAIVDLAPVLPSVAGEEKSIAEEMKKMTDKHCVSVRFTEDELRKIDAYRGKIPRGTWCRRAILGKPIAVPPEPNREKYAETARWAANLAQIAHHLNRGEMLELEDVRRELSAFRRSLLGLREEGKNRES